MTFRLGMNGKLYFKAGGQSAGGVYAELSNVRDLTLALEASEADLTTRANNGWRAIVAALRTGSLEWEMVWDTADAGFTAIKNAYLNNAIIALQCLDGVDGQGLQGDFMVTNFSRAEPLEQGMTVSVSVKLAYSDTPPTWLE